MFIYSFIYIRFQLLKYSEQAVIVLIQDLKTWVRILI